MFIYCVLELCVSHWWLTARRLSNRPAATFWLSIDIAFARELSPPSLLSSKFKIQNKIERIPGEIQGIDVM